MADSKHAAIVMAVAVTIVAFGGLLVTFSGPTVTGSTTGPVLDTADTLVEHERLVHIHPRVGAAHRYIMTHPQIEIVEEQGVDYIALVHVDVLPELRTMAEVTYLSS